MQSHNAEGEPPLMCVLSLFQSFYFLLYEGRNMAGTLHIYTWHWEQSASEVIQLNDLSCPHLHLNEAE